MLYRIHRFSLIVHDAKRFCERAERMLIGNWYESTSCPQRARYCRLCMNYRR
jgi:hypothetical protein